MHSVCFGCPPFPLLLFCLFASIELHYTSRVVYSSATTYIFVVERWAEWKVIWRRGFIKSFCHYKNGKHVFWVRVVSSSSAFSGFIFVCQDYLGIYLSYGSR